MRPGRVFIALWVAWAISWLLAAWWSSRAEGRPPLGTEIRYRTPMLMGSLLLAIPAHGYEGVLRLWHVGWTFAWCCVAVEAMGFAFAWWARVHLGKLWSGRVTRKADHEVIDTGPYAIVRHPIYTGLLLALLATAGIKGTLPGLAGFALLLLGIWMKARLEERWLTAELGADRYASYRKRVPMLLPFGPT